MIIQNSRHKFLFLNLLLLILSIFTVPGTISAATIRVPQDQTTIQAGIDAARDGDLVLVAPGTYTEQLIITGKNIILASQFYSAGDTQFINSTVIDGSRGQVVTVSSSAGGSTRVIGFTIRNGSDGIKANGKVYILNNYVTKNGDGIDYSSGNGLIRNNVFENNSDDGVDLDGASGAIIENNTMLRNHDDGIEVRLHQYSGPTLNIVIRGNIISANAEDGIQLIDYPDLSDRFFLIERNVIYNNAMVGLGLMDNGITIEDFRAASIPERIHVFNNTFVGNPYSITGGDNLIAVNNLFVSSANIALKNVDANSIVADSLFWDNNTDYQGSNIDLSTTLFTDPLFVNSLSNNYQLRDDSPAINTGTDHYARDAETVLDLPSCTYADGAPDLGRFEHNFAPAMPKITSLSPASGSVGTAVTITGTGFACTTSVAFNGKTAPFTASSTAIQTAVPSGATTGPLSVTTPAGTIDSSNDFKVAVPTQNLLLNPGFESDANNDGRPDKWSTNSRFTRNSSVVHSGSYAGKHFSTADDGYTISQTVSNLAAGNIYRVSGWVNIPATSDAFTFKLQVRWRNASNSTISTKTLKTFTVPTNGWVEATGNLIAPAGTTNAQVRMAVSSLKATIYVDDFIFGP